MNPALLAALITLTAEAIKMFPEAMKAYGEIVAAWSKSDQTAVSSAWAWSDGSVEVSTLTRAGAVFTGSGPGEPAFTTTPIIEMITALAVVGLIVLGFLNRIP